MYSMFARMVPWLMMIVPGVFLGVPTGLLWLVLDAHINCQYIFLDGIVVFPTFFYLVENVWYPMYISKGAKKYKLQNYLIALIASYFVSFLFVAIVF